MTLLLPSLQSSLATAGAQGLLPGATRDSQIDAFCDAYYAYSLAATTPFPATLVPVSVNIISLKSILLASASKDAISYLDPANEWSDAFEVYWATATFAPVGSVVPVSLSLAKAQLAVNLAQTWESSKNGLATVTSAFNSIASVLHTFTISINTTTGLIL